MASPSPSFHNNLSNPLTSSISRSTAQMGLQKILNIISSASYPLSNNNFPKGLEIDLNLSLCAFPEAPNSENPTQRDAPEVGFSDSSSGSPKDEKCGEGNAGKSDFSKGYLYLLLEAARYIEDEPSPEKKKKTDTETAEPAEVDRCAGRKRNRGWAFDLYEAYGEDTTPVVRSKRGRNRVLPSRYRDSVLEPWRPPPRQRR